MLLLRNPGPHRRALGFIVSSDPVALVFILPVQLHKQLFVISLPRRLTRPGPEDGEAFLKTPQGRWTGAWAGIRSRDRRRFYENGRSL